MTKQFRNNRRGGFKGNPGIPLADPAARALQHKYLPLMEANFIESNPIPVKTALGLMGLLDPVFRLPMVPPKPENLEKIASVLSQLGLLAARSVPVAN